MPKGIYKRTPDMKTGEHLKQHRWKKCQLSPNWNGFKKGHIMTKTGRYISCEVCGKQLYVKKHKFESTKFCSSKCYGVSMIGQFSGSKHFNWKGGKSFEPYPLGWTKTHREQIRYRDGYKCQLCGVPEIEHGKRLSVHHIDYNKENINPSNLISLCKSCHTKTNFNRTYWTSILSKAKKEGIE